MAFLQVIWDGNDITQETLSYQRQSILCNSYGSIALVIDGHTGRNYQPWDTITVYEDSNKVGEYFIVEISITDDDGSAFIVAENSVKKLNDYFIPRLIKPGGVTTCKYWIQRFLDDAKVSYNFTDSGSGSALPKETVFEPDTAYNLVVPLLQKSGWYLYFDKNNVAQIGKLDTARAVAGAYNHQTILEINVTTDDKMLRNRAVVWGNTDRLTGQRIKASIQRPTVWDYDANDIRTVVIADNHIRNTGLAYTLADKIIKEFEKPTVIKHFSVAGPQDVQVTDYLRVTSSTWTGIGMVTEITTAYTPDGGFVTTFTLDQRCPRIWGYSGVGDDYVYIGTESTGVWRKQLSSDTWTDYSTGLPTGVGIRDLHIYNGLFACVTTSGTAYYRVIDDASWTQINLSGTYTDALGTTYPVTSVEAKYCVIDRNSDYNIEVGLQTIPPASGRPFHVRYSPVTQSVVNTQPIYLSGKHNLNLLDITRTFEDSLASVKEARIQTTYVVSGTISATDDGGFGAHSVADFDTQIGYDGAFYKSNVTLPVIVDGDSYSQIKTFISTSTLTNFVSSNAPGTGNLGRVWYMKDAGSNLYDLRTSYVHSGGYWNNSLICTTTSGTSPPWFLWKSDAGAFSYLAEHPVFGNYTRYHYVIDTSTGNLTRTTLYQPAGNDYNGGITNKYYCELYRTFNSPNYYHYVYVVDMEAGTYTNTSTIIETAARAPIKGFRAGSDGWVWVYTREDSGTIYAQAVGADSSGNVFTGNETAVFSVDDYVTEGASTRLEGTSTGNISYTQTGRYFFPSFTLPIAKNATYTNLLFRTDWSSGGKLYYKFYTITIKIDLTNNGNITTASTVQNSVLNVTDSIWTSEGITAPKVDDTYAFTFMPVGNIYGDGYVAQNYNNGASIEIANKTLTSVLGVVTPSSFDTASLTFTVFKDIARNTDCTDDVIYAVCRTSTADYLVGFSSTGAVKRQFTDSSLSLDARDLAISHNLVLIRDNSASVYEAIKYIDNFDYVQTRTDAVTNYHILKQITTSGVWENIKPSGTRPYLFDENLSLPLLIYPRNPSGYTSDLAGFVYATNAMTQAGWYTEQGSRGIEMWKTHDARTFSATGGFVVESGIINKDIMSKIGIVGDGALRVIDANLSGYYSTVKTFSGWGEPVKFETSNIDNPPYMFVVVSGGGKHTFYQRNPTESVWNSKSVALPSGYVTIIRMDDQK